jgi:HD domain
VMCYERLAGQTLRVSATSNPPGVRAEAPDGLVPTRFEAQATSRRLLAGQGSRLPHVLAAGCVAETLSELFNPQEHQLLVAAATLHDIGYSSAIAHTGFHPLDGAVHLVQLGYSMRLAALVAHHSHAHLMAAEQGVLDLADRFPREQSLLADALVYSDMHASPDGHIIDVEVRLADIGRRHRSAHLALRSRLIRESVARVQAHVDGAAPPR